MALHSLEVACTLVPTASALAKSWGQREQTSAPSTAKAQLQSAQPQTQSNHVMWHAGSITC